ncbi:transglutaminase-like cysteine peptidase [Gilvimarinus sp. F26214L]|uniref:transglutaminase-like cysteine peptidase n=1 Tax=Gilvimarinus sp. DZF01 TaxID=3461371 RepID=UPI004046114A
MQKSFGVVSRVSCIVVALISMSAGCSHLSSSPEPELSGVASQVHQRVDEWFFFRRQMEQAQALSELEKVVRTNDFVNTIAYRADEDHWEQEDYWATPMETLTTEGGDCEDFAIAKYFTLRDIGIDPERLRLTYVWHWQGAEKEAHMVLTYLPEQGGEPLVLDNLNPQVLPRNERPDLEAVYSFNEENLWLAGNPDQALDVPSQKRLDKWRDVNARMAREQAAIYAGR